MKLFHVYGEMCASHPWEVIVTMLTISLCMLTMEQKHLSQTFPKLDPNYCNLNCTNDYNYNATDMIVMTFIRCIAVLYSYYQFRSICNFRSKYILCIAGFFTVFSSFVFTSAVLNFLRIDFSDLKDALFFFLLLIDLSKAALLAEFALRADDQQEVVNNIANGMSALGPKLTLDTIVETLVIGIGTLSGVHRLEMLSYFACLSALVNYVVFMTFYPACLSLILELKNKQRGKSQKATAIISKVFTEEQKSNPIIERVKIIMSVGLLMVHLHSRWPFTEEEVLDASQHKEPALNNKTSNESFQTYILNWITLSADHIVILIILLALVIKFVFFENKEEIADQLNVDIDVRERKRFPSQKPYFNTKSFFLDDTTTCADVHLEEKEIQTEHFFLETEGDYFDFIKFIHLNKL